MRSICGWLVASAKSSVPRVAEASSCVTRRRCLQRPRPTCTAVPSPDAKPALLMTPTRWLLTALSFAATIGVSVYMIVGWSQDGTSLALPPRAHLLALLAVMVEVFARALKIRWSARAAGIRLPLGTALRTCLGGDFGAAITPARSGAEHNMLHQVAPGHNYVSAE